MKKLLIPTIFIIAALTLLTVRFIEQNKQLEQIQKKSEQLVLQAETLQTELETYKNIPDYLIDAYVKCKMSNVPSNFEKDCVCYEIKGY